MSKKLSKKEKYERRHLEALKALNKANSQKYTNTATNNFDSLNGIKLDNKTELKKFEPLSKNQLPINVIKKDLLKTSLFAVFSIVLLVVLKFSPIHL